MRKEILFSSAAILLMACGQATQPPESPTATPASAPQKANAEIQWFDGSVADALSVAEQTQTPIFLYWGAHWCPPCNQIKSTIFVREDFIEKTRAFIAVYLDGDSDGAQRWGEYFGTSGYPTLIVLQPDGTEITRVSSGMDAVRYPEVLDLALQRRRPVKTLVDQLKQNDGANGLTPADWSLLALYGWEADSGRTIAPEELASELAEMGAMCPASLPLQRNRLLLLGAVAARDNNQPIAPEMAAALRSILEDPAQVRYNLSELQYYGAKLLDGLIPAESADRSALEDLMQTRMSEMFADESLPTKQRLLTTRLLIDLAKLDEQHASEPLQNLARARAQWADGQARTDYERQSLIANAAWYLHDVGLNDEARQMFERELSRAVAPHYYMSYLAAIEEELGNADKALEWSKRAWLEAEGPATKTQWGSSHLVLKLSLAPDDLDGIAADTDRLLSEMRSSGDGFHQRSLKRTERLRVALTRWSEEDEKHRQPIAMSATARLKTLCEVQLGDKSQTCDSFR